MKKFLGIETCQPSWTTVGKRIINKNIIVNYCHYNASTIYSLIMCQAFYML